MPQGSSKKKKGRAPAHQNTFAFQHNPKSKKTEKILASPNIHVCRRCHDKIEWRKKYRKYRPLTQPSKCNLCNQRKVKAAYHTICTDCTTSEKARKDVAARLNKGEAALTTQNETNSGSRSTNEPEVYRACAVCVKEPALRGEGDGSNETRENMPAKGMGRLRLRERRALERKLARQTEEAKQAKPKPDQEDSDDSEKEVSDVQVSDCEVEDPFLKAVGGADNLLTGEAYQQMLLERGGQPT